MVNVSRHRLALLRGVYFLLALGAGSLAGVMVQRGVPTHICSDDGAEFTSKPIREWLQRIGAKTLYIEPGSRWENGYCESFNGKQQQLAVAP